MLVAALIGASSIAVLHAATRDWELRPEYLESPDNWVAIHSTLLRERRRSTVLIGNSVGGQILYNRPGGHGELTPVDDIYFLTAMSTAVGEWYWMLRKMIAPLEPQPSLVVFVFFGDNLTVPLGMGPNLPPLMRAIQTYNGKDASSLAMARRRTAPGYHIVLGVKRLLCRFSDGCRTSADWTINTALREAQVRQVYDETDGRATQPRRMKAVQGVSPEVEGMIARSYLPPLIDAAEDAGIPLLFIQSKEKCVYSEAGCLDFVKTVTAKEYYDGVRHYIESRGAAFVDFSHDPRLRLDDFSDGVHFKPESLPTFSRMVEDAIARERQRLSGRPL